MQKQLSVFIGRFSPFHLGHEEVLFRALQSSEVVLLLIGSANQARNTKNPFTGQERQAMVQDWYNTLARHKKVGALVIKLIEDHPYNDQEWIAEVQNAVMGVYRQFDTEFSKPIYLTGAERDASTWYLKAFGNFFKLDFVKETAVGFDYSATQLRDDYFSGGNKWEYKTPEAVINFLDKFKHTEIFKSLVDEYEFIKRYKASWKNAPYAPTFVTVDTCVIQSGHVLLVRRAAQPGRGLWALPGGFIEQDETLLDAAIRELIEETSIELSPRQLYGSVVDKELFDHPGRSLRGRTITTCFLLKLEDTFALPKVKPQKGEGMELKWMPIAEAKANTEMWYEDHGHIFKTMLGLVKN